MNDIVKKTDKWRNEKSQLEVKMSGFERTRKEIQVKINEFENKKTEILDLTEKLRAFHVKIGNLKNNQGATIRAEEKYKKTMNTCLKGILNSVEQKRVIIEKISSQLAKTKMEEIKLQKYKIENADIENSIASAKEALDNSTRLFDTIRSAYERSKITYNNKKAKAFETCENKNPNDQDFPYKEQFETITNDLQQLNDEINELQARVECMTSENMNVIDEFEQRQKEIQRLELVIMESLQNSTQTQARIFELHNKWFPKIKETVSEINKYFGEFMRSMEYAGEVQLIHDEDMVNILLYTLYI